MKDSEVIDRIKRGDEKAIEFLYQKHFNMMLKMILKNNGSETEAKDVYQDTLIVFWEKVAKGDFELRSRISTYLYSVCQNLWRKELERKKRLSSEEKDGVSYQEIHQKERVQAITQCISQLSDTCQKVLGMYYFDGLSMLDIAEKLNFSNANTAKTKKYKCKKELDALVTSKYTASDFLD